MSAEGPVQPGRLIGHFRTGTMLGAGGMGQVFLAEDERTGNDVALKLLHPRWSGDDWLVELFHKEAELVRSLSHPNLVALLDVGEDSGLHFLVFEFIHGIPLDRLLAEGALDQVLAASITQDIALGLAAAHAAGVVHRDIKPANVMITPDDRIKLIDFGVADRSGAKVGSVDVPADMAGPGQTGVCGTRIYSAPEQNQGRPATPAADVYSLGILAYELFSGKRLFRDGELGEVLRLQAKLQGILDQSPSLHPRIPPPVARVIRKMLQLLPQDRYASAQECLPDLEVALSAIGGVRRGALAQSKRTALADLAETLFLKGQAALAEDDLDTAAAEFSRILALEPPNRERFVASIREAVQTLFWRPARIGQFPVRLLDMLEELGLTDLRYLVEHHLTKSAKGSPEEILRRLGIYLGRWPRSAAMLRAAAAAARALAPEKAARFVRRLGDVLLDMGEPAAALRCYRELDDLGQQDPEVERRRNVAREAAVMLTEPHAEFHAVLEGVLGLDDPAEAAELWKGFLAIHPTYAPAQMEAARTLEKAGDRIGAGRLASELGRRAFAQGALKEARRWLTAAVRLDPERDEALLYLAEMTGGVPEARTTRDQRVIVLRRAGLAEAALYHREMDLTGGEQDSQVLAEMAEIAEEWRLDPSPFVLRRARLELGAGRDEAAKDLILEALERATDTTRTAARVLELPGAVRALGQALFRDLQKEVAERSPLSQPSMAPGYPGASAPGTEAEAETSDEATERPAPSPETPTG